MTAAVMAQYRRPVSWVAALNLTHENNYMRDGRRGKAFAPRTKPLSLYLARRFLGLRLN